MNPISAFLGSCVLGGLIGLFPLLTNGSVPAAKAAIGGEGDAGSVRSITVNAGANIIKVNDVLVADPSFLIEGKTYIPARLLERVGANVYWDNATQTASIRFPPSGGSR
jgi:hypothetical protein